MLTMLSRRLALSGRLRQTVFDSCVLEAQMLSFQPTRPSTSTSACLRDPRSGCVSPWTALARGFAKRTAAEEYNVIEAEPQLVRIDSCPQMHVGGRCNFSNKNRQSQVHQVVDGPEGAVASLHNAATWTLPVPDIIIGKCRYSDDGFVVNGIPVDGAIMCTSQLWTRWAVPDFDAISQDSLAMLDLFKPIPDMVVIGCGTRIRMLPSELRAWLASRGVGVEAVDTANAVGLFNILNQEGRVVVAGLLPAGS